LPQACNDPSSRDPLKRRNHRPPSRGPVRIAHHRIDRHVFLVLTVGANGADGEGPNDALGARVEIDRGVLGDDSAIEGWSGDEEAPQRLLFG
jgi:hypothetical protein